jgi:hypothetical protein
MDEATPDADDRIPARREPSFFANTLVSDACASPTSSGASVPL